MTDPRNVEMAKHLSFFVPAEHVLTTREWVDQVRDRVVELEMALTQIMSGVHWTNDDFRMYARDVLARTPGGEK